MGGRDAHIGHQAARQLRHITHHNRVHRAQMVVHRTAVFDLYFAIVGRKLADERGDGTKIRRLQADSFRKQQLAHR